MFAITLCLLFLLHVNIQLFFSNILSHGALIVLLYILNLLSILIMYVLERYPLLFRDVVDKSTLTAEDLHIEPNESKTLTALTKTNLYIQQWRKKVLNKPQQFPLDRLAYLSAKFFTCSRRCQIALQPSQFKRLILKADYRPYEQYEEDPHPVKMVDELCHIYIHKKAAFYRNRKTTIVDRKQSTFVRIEEPVSPGRLSPKVLRKLNFEHLSDASSEESSEEYSSGESDERRPSFWKRISTVLRLSPC